MISIVATFPGSEKGDLPGMEWEVLIQINIIGG